MSVLHGWHWECVACRYQSIKGCGGPHWRVEADGFAIVTPAKSAAAAKYALFKAAREGGYFSGRRGFRDFVHRLPAAHEVRA